jgi:hypothetical protein
MDKRERIGEVRNGRLDRMTERNRLRERKKNSDNDDMVRMGTIDRAKMVDARERGGGREMRK